eukprot:3660437-Prymnesium_polylepis.1
MYRGNTQRKASRSKLLKSEAVGIDKSNKDLVDHHAAALSKKVQELKKAATSLGSELQHDMMAVERRLAAMEHKAEQKVASAAHAAAAAAPKSLADLHHDVEQIERRIEVKFAQAPHPSHRGSKQRKTSGDSPGGEVDALFAATRLQAAVRGSTVRRLTKRGREIAREKRELAIQDEPLVRLLDFGIAQTCPVTHDKEGQKGRVDDSVMKSGGTPAFYAPEMMQKGAYHGRPADVWAAGVSLCMMVSGKLPFEADDLPSSEFMLPHAHKQCKHTRRPQRSHRRPSPALVMVHTCVSLALWYCAVFQMIKISDPVIPDDITDECAELLRKLLIKDPSRRPTVAALRTDDW